MPETMFEGFKLFKTELNENIIINSNINSSKILTIMNDYLSNLYFF